MNKPFQAVLIGGGSSIKEQLPDLWKKIENKFTLGINYSYKFFNSTVLCCVDTIPRSYNLSQPFFEMNYNELSQLPLVIGAKHKHSLIPPPNTLLLPADKVFDRTLKNGVFRGNLSGIFALTLAIHLLDVGEIFALGLDGFSKKIDEKKRFLTHFYQGSIEHKGIGKVGFYNNKRLLDICFKPFLQETKVKIYNVSPESTIPYLEKIDYKTFYEKLDDKTYDQKELQDWILLTLKPFVKV